MLLRWLSARYPSFPVPDEIWQSLGESAWHSHERVTEAFITLAREQHSQGELDAEVQIGLGVLYYTNGQYDRAKDCFEAALSVRPTVGHLTLYAGSIAADHGFVRTICSGIDSARACLTAINQRRPWVPTGRPCSSVLPTRVRYTTSALHVRTDLYNAGRLKNNACPRSALGLNIGAHQEAAEHFLSALAMQDSSGGTKSDQVWFTLRRTMLSMVRSPVSACFPLCFNVYS